MNVVCKSQTMNNHREVKNGLSVLQHILEKDELLDIQEKASLVFLMCDDAVKALHILTKNIFESEKWNKILPELVGYLRQTNQEIFNKFLESFILIKNYQVVKQLGFDIDNLKIMFEERENKQYINCVRKALLEMCESLCDNELTDLIGLIEQDFIDQGSFFSDSNLKLKLILPETNLMEFNLLYLISEDYICDGTNNRESNVNYLIEHLQKMNKHDLAEELKKVDKTHSINENMKLSIMCPDNDFAEKNYLLNFAPKRFVSSHTDCYKMDKSHMGLCVIVNQRDFCEEQCLVKGVKLGTRTGTNCDREILKITFTGLGFKTVILENLSSDTLLEYLKKILQSVQKVHSSFVLCILSHGKHGGVYCVDGIPIQVEVIERMISQDPKLLGKPKLIFIQACQGNDFQKALPCNIIIQQNNNADDGDDCKMPESDGPTELNEQKVPPTADMLTFWATVPGFASFRHPQAGTAFVKTLCAWLLKSGHSPNHLEDIVTCVNHQLSETQFGEESYVSMPQVRHTLTKKLYFPYCPQHRLKAAQMLYFKFLVEALIERCTVQEGAYIHLLKKKLKKKNMTCITK